MKKEKSCGAIIIKKDNSILKVLVVKQNNNFWSFPKGHMEFGESEEETAIREVKEETNLDIKINESYREVITYSPKEKVIKDVVFFISTFFKGNVKIQEKEINEYKWINIYDCLDLFDYTENKYIVQTAINYLENNGYFYDYFFGDKNKDLFILVHGFGSNGNSTTNSYLKERFRENNISYISFDLPGISYGVLSVNNCLEVLDKVYNFVKNNFKYKSINIFGTSFGGYLSLLDSINNKDRYSKIILRSPALKMYDVFKNTNDDDINKDSIFGVKVSSDFLNELKDSDLFSLYKNNRDILIIHGDKDDTVSIDDSVQFSKKFNTELKIMNGSGHRMHKREELKFIYDSVIDFINNKK